MGGRHRLREIALGSAHRRLDKRPGQTTDAVGRTERIFGIGSHANGYLFHRKTYSVGASVLGFASLSVISLRLGASFPAGVRSAAR
jgi:hypothetical protein